mmetsp:Transcript_40334/g.90437  ORF Transcript_40334/g.90437 Transcript_40334/m.90437 type:complete len:109 (-) Transcript_40334:57-383(-)
MIFRAYDDKHKKHRQLHSSHSFEGDTCKGCGKTQDNYLGYFAHFFFTGQSTIEKMIYKMKRRPSDIHHNIYKSMSHILISNSTGTTWTAAGRARASLLCRHAESHIGW